MSGEAIVFAYVSIMGCLLLAVLVVSGCVMDRRSRRR